MINNPQFVEFLISDDGKTFAVRSCPKNSLRSFRVRLNTNSKTGKVEFYSLSLSRILARINHWNDDSSYRVYGTAFPDQKIAVFDFSSSEIITDTQRDI